MKFERTRAAVAGRERARSARLVARVDEQRARVRAEAHGPGVARARERDRPGQRAPGHARRDERARRRSPTTPPACATASTTSAASSKPGLGAERDLREARRVERRVERAVVVGLRVQLDRAPGAGVLREQRVHGLEDRLLVRARLEVHGATRGADRASGWRSGSG